MLGRIVYTTDLCDTKRRRTMKIYIANHKNESFADCKARQEAMQAKAKAKKQEEEKRGLVPFTLIPVNPFNGLN